MSDPTAIATAYLSAYAAKYAAADGAGLAALYGPDSVVSMDGGSVKSAAAIAGALAPRMAGGPVHLRWSTSDAQATAQGHIIVFTTGDSTVPAGKFSSVATLFPASSPLGLYARNEVIRFGPGGLAHNTTLDASGLGAAFATQYYQCYNTNKAGLAGVYREHSTLRFEDKEARGLAGISELQGRMPKGTMALKTLDVQPVTPDNSIVLLLVTGEMVLEGESHPLAFSHAFQVVNNPAEGGPYVSNEFFRFNYA